MEDLLTKQELAKHWKVSEATIDQYRKDGIVQTCKLPTVRFNPQHIRELDGVKLEKFSPLERRRIETELEKWKERALRAEKIITKITILANQALYDMQIEKDK